MFASSRFHRLGPPRAALVLLGTVLLGTCTEGRNPAGLLGDSQLSMALGTGFLRELAPDEVRPIERIRVTANEVPGGASLGGTTFQVDPQAAEWTLDFSLAIPAASTVVVTLSVELISFSAGTELVDWSGRTGSMTLRVGTQTEIRDLPLFKGPLANLSVTGVTIQEPVSPLREGQSAQLIASAATTTPQDPPTLFWRSLSPGVATVSGSGNVQALLPGLARIVATAGAAADTVTVTVLPGPASVALEPDGVVLDALGEEVVFTATVLDPRGDPVPGDAVTWTVGDPEILQNLGSGQFRSASRGITSVSAGSTIDPGVSRSAEVVVRQVVTAVDVIPEEAFIFMEEAAEFQAVALDANENPIEGMGFSWSTSDPGVAAVDGNGLANGIAAGTATILAEALSGVMGGADTGSLAPTPGTTGIATLVILPEVARVVVSPNPFTFRSLGEGHQFTAQAFDVSGNPIPVPGFDWTSANEAVVAVDDTGLATSVANGSTVLRAEIRGVTGTTAVFVSQTVATVTISPDTWTFFCPEGCEAHEFSGRAYDALGNRVSGIQFLWTSTEYCFEVTSPMVGVPAERATVNDNCGCDTSPGDLRAVASGRVGVAYLQPPACEFPVPPASPSLRPLLAGFLDTPLPAESPFRMGAYHF